MKKIFLLLVIAFLFVHHHTDAQNISHKPIGQTGNWSGSLLAATCNGSLYTIDTVGKLIRSHLGTGEKQAVNDQYYGNSIRLWGGGKNLFTLENDGSLYRTHPETGQWSILGKAGDWINTVLAVPVYGYLYSVEKNGTLYATNVNTGNYLPLGKPDFAGCTSIYETGGSLYLTGASGNLMQVSEADGSWKQVLAPQSLTNSIGAAVLSGKLYSLENDGSLIRYELPVGTKTVLGKISFKAPVILMAAGIKLYLLDASGTLQEISL